MRALNSHLFPSDGYSILNDAVSHEWKDLSEDSGNLESIFHLPSSFKPQFEVDEPAADHGGGGKVASTSVADKKLNHNAKERDRRRHTNTLFSTLLSLIPAADQMVMQKLTNPAIVSLALEYIPEIQHQVKVLLEKKHGLSKKKQAKSLGSAAISTNHLNDGEITIHISTCHKIPLSDILSDLEEDGLQLVNASSFESYAGRVLYSLHLKVEKAQGFECQVLNNKLSLLYEQKRFADD